MKSSEVLSPEKEEELLRKLNKDVKKFILDHLQEFGKIFGSRIYDELKRCDRETLIDKIYTGLYGYPGISDEKKERNTKNAEKILDLILEKNKEGLDHIYMNYVTVFHVKLDLKSTTSDVQMLNMFRFSKYGAHEKPEDNFFIGTDNRLYKSWADFIRNHKLPHGALVFAPAGGHFLFHNGELNLELYHVTRYMRTFVEPVLGGVGLVGTGLLCVTLPPAGLALGLGAAGVGAVSGATRGIIDLKDRMTHKTLFSASSLLPTLDLVGNLLFVHSALGALRLSSTVLASEKFALSVLFTEKALRISAISRLSLDVLHTIVAVGLGQLSFANGSARLVASFLFLYNAGFSFTLDPESMEQLLLLPPTLLTYENVMHFIRLARDFFNLPAFYLVENADHFYGLLSLVLQNLNGSRSFQPMNLHNILHRLMNINWKMLSEDFEKCNDFVNDLFTHDKEFKDLKSNIQLAIVYNLYHKLLSHIHHFPEEIKKSQFIEIVLMPQIVDLWKKMCRKIYPGERPVAGHSKVMQYLLKKIDEILRPDDGSVVSSASTKSSFVYSNEIYNRLKEGLFNADENRMCEECRDMINSEKLQPICHTMKNKYVAVSLFKKPPTHEEALGIVDDYERDRSITVEKLDPATNLGILIEVTTPKREIASMHW